MNKEDSIKEKFKQALQSTYKVISEDYKVGKNKKKEEKIYTRRYKATWCLYS